MLLPEQDRVVTHQQISVLDQSLSQLEAVELKLASELDDIRSKISRIRYQRAALESRIAAVWSLPNELLSYIFELGVLEQRAEEDEAGEGEDVEDSDEEETSPRKVGFQVLVSQVCRTFRQVAIRTPSLWTEIHLFDLTPQQLDFAQTCVERSGNSGLDILLYSEQQYVTAEGGGLRSFISILGPHISRFKRLTVRLQGLPSLHFIMQALNTPAPLLETLELSDIDYDAAFDEEAPLDPSELRKPLTLFQGTMPILNRLALDGAHVDWSTCNFNNLVELQLSYHTRDVRPTYEQFKAIIEASPGLRILDLSGSAPIISEDAVESALYMPILMEHLSELTLSDISSDYVATLISLLRAPNLKLLALTDMDANDYSTLVRKVAGPPQLFPALTALKLATLEVEEEACEELLRAYPTLTYLALYLNHMNDTWLEALEPRGADNAVLCPKLECLRCVGAAVADIQRLLSRRKDAGFPIPRLELDQNSVGWATTGTMKWIRENTEVEIIVPSEHGTDDEDDDFNTGSEWATDDGEGIGFPFITMGGFSDMDDMDDDEDEDEDEDEDYEGDSDIEIDGDDANDTDDSDEE